MSNYLDEFEVILPNKQINLPKQNKAPYHAETTAFTTEMLKGRKVRVVYDVVKKDRYNRDLVYVYLMDGISAHPQAHYPGP